MATLTPVDVFDPITAADGSNDASFTSFIAHEPVAGFGQAAGGAGLVALEYSYMPNGRLLAPDEWGGQTAAIQSLAGPLSSGSISNTQLLGTFLRDAECMRAFQGHLADCPVTISHYYVAGAITGALDLGEEHSRVYMGHSWDLIVAHMDPLRRVDQARVAAEREVIRTANVIITATRVERDLLGSLYGPDEVGTAAILDKAVVIPLGVDQKRFNPEIVGSLRNGDIRKEYLPEDLWSSQVFYCLGRMSPQKSQVEIVEAFTSLMTTEGQGKDLALVLIGGPLQGEYFDRVAFAISQADEATRKRIVLLPAMNPTEAHALGDVLLFPSKWETFGLVGAEAMACGNPVIFSDLPILKEVGGDAPVFFNRSDGLISVRNLQQAMSRFATDGAGFHQQRSAACLTRGREFTWERTAALFQGIWK